MIANPALQHLRILLGILLLAIAIPLGSALAQDAEQAAGKAERTYKELDTSIDKLRADLSSVALTNEELEAKRQELEKLRTDALEAQNELQRPLGDSRAKLKNLGEAPAEGESESESIAAKRQGLTQEVARLEAVSKQLGLLVLEASQLSTLAGERQRRNFVNRVFEGSRSVLNPLLWIEGLATVPQLVSRLNALIGSWRTFDTDKGTYGFWIVIGVLAVTFLCISALWMGWGRPTYIPLPQDDALRRMWRAMRVSIYSFIVIMIAIAVLNVLVEMPPRAARLVDTLMQAIIVAATAIALLRGVFRPRKSAMRLVNMSNLSAASAFQLSFLAILLVAVGLVVKEVESAIFLPVEFSIAWSASVTIALIVIMASFLVVVRQSGDIEEQPEGSADRIFYFGWTKYFFHVAWIVVLLAALALLTGHVALAHYVTTRLVMTAALILFLVMVHHFIDALVRSGLDARTYVGRFLRNTISLGETAIGRLGLLLSSLTDVALVLFGVPLVLIQWTLTWVDFRSWLTTAFFGFKIGDITIEPSSILLAFMVLGIGLVVARLFTTWLERRVLSQTQIDSGVRNSISTGANYAGILIAGGIAVTSAGLDFSNLAIVVGALGVGIGFGLQSIVNNFVSGLILLAERPIKVGDWISVTGGEGIVKRINVRSTEIETFDRCSVIVPNSSLISEPVSNWYHDELIGRTKVMVGVSYDSDPEQVEQILLQCAREADHVMAFPAPNVLFRDFGASSLDFELRAFIDDVGWVAFVASDLRFKIFKAFKEAGIEIPFPQQDLHVKALPEDSVIVEAVRKPDPKDA